jgi:hypothetical protein
MPKTQPVAISVTIIVNAPVSETLPEDSSFDSILDTFLTEVSERLGASIAALKQEPWFEQDAGTNYHYLLEEPAGRCTRCGRWTSDFEAPQYFDLVTTGTTVEGQLLCVECASFLATFQPTAL